MFTTLRTIIVLGSCLWLVSGPVYANSTLIVNITDVTDGDSLRAGDLRLRLFGIDAPERRQTCQDKMGADYPCGLDAQARLKELAPIGTKLTCEHIDTDRYKRLVVSCKNADTDIAQQLVADGLAIAYRYYSHRYVEAEISAKTAERGMWQGAFLDPFEFRKSKRKN